MKTRHFLFAGIAAMLMLQPVVGQSAPPVMDAKASGEWIAKLFEVRDGKMFVATRDLDHLPDIRYKVPEGTEIKPLAGGFSVRGVILDQPGLYPVEIDCVNLGMGEYSLGIDSPFHYLNDAGTPDPDEASRVHPKGGVIEVSELRAIAEILFRHFSKITGKKPVVFRTQDVMTYPAEAYAWEHPDFLILLGVYIANDHSGISVTVKRPEGEVEKLAKRKPTDQEPIKGWGAPISQ